MVGDSGPRARQPPMHPLWGMTGPFRDLSRWDSPPVPPLAGRETAVLASSLHRAAGCLHSLGEGAAPQHGEETTTILWMENPTSAAPEG